MRAVRCGACLGAILLISASCVNKGTPTPPSPTVSSVAFVSSTDVLKVQETFNFTASAAHSDGSSAQVTEWRSDTPAVATVDSVTGKVTGVGPGTASIIATHDGVSATKLLRVVPDFGGTWKGAFRVTGCTGSGRIADICDATALILGELEFQCSQTRDQATGTLKYGYTLEAILHPVGPVPVTGTIDAGGHLRLSGSSSNARGFNFLLRADGNDLYASSDHLHGTSKTEMWHPTLISGRVTFTHTITGKGLSKAGS